jgi:trimeric autotransporter adhesin
MRNSRIEINWSTESEINNKEFEVQRSADGVSFETFAKVPGKLFSTATSWYAAFDYQYSTGRNYYRVKQVDLDGNFKYSRVVMVLIKEKAQVVLYPNPARTEVNISIGTQVNASAVRVVNTMGQTVLTRTLSGNSQTINIGIGQLPSGVYFTELLNASDERIWRGTFVKE